MEHSLDVPTQMDTSEECCSYIRAAMQLKKSLFQKKGVGVYQRVFSCTHLFVVRGWVWDGPAAAGAWQGRGGAAACSIGPTAGPCHKPWRGPAGYPQATLWGLLWALPHVPCGAAGLSAGPGLCVRYRGQGAFC